MVDKKIDRIKQEWDYEKIELDYDKCLDSLRDFYKVFNCKNNKPDLIIANNPNEFLEYENYIYNNNLNYSLKFHDTKSNINKSVLHYIKDELFINLGDQIRHFSDKYPILNKARNSIYFPLELKYKSLFDVLEKNKDSFYNNKFKKDIDWNKNLSHIFSKYKNDVFKHHYNRNLQINIEPWLFCFYNYFLDTFKSIDEDLRGKMYSFINLIKNGILDILFYEDFCVILPYPKKYVNDNGETEIIKYDDTYLFTYISNLEISPESYNRLKNKTYTFEEWTQETNEEIKSAVLKFFNDNYGGEYVYRFLSEHLKEIDTYIDKKDEEYLNKTTNGMNLGVYTLFKGVIKYTNNTIERISGRIPSYIENRTIAFVRCYCPSTDRMFFLGVNGNKINNAKDGIASLCRVPKKLKKHIKSINRQGEIFSISFDEDGTKLLKENILTKQDFLNSSSLSGDEYFSKIKYEY